VTSSTTLDLSETMLMGAKSFCAQRMSNVKKTRALRERDDTNLVRSIDLQFGVLQSSPFWSPRI